MFNFFLTNRAPSNSSAMGARSTCSPSHTPPSVTQKPKHSPQPSMVFSPEELHNRTIRTNLRNIDLEEIYDKTEVSFGGIETIRMNEKEERYSEQLHERNRQGVERRRGRENRIFFINCVGFSFPEHSGKLFANGNIQMVCIPDEATYDKNLKLLFDLLETLGYEPKITEVTDHTIYMPKTTEQPMPEDISEDPNEVISEGKVVVFFRAAWKTTLRLINLFKVDIPSVWSVVYIRYDGEYLPNSRATQIGVYSTYEAALETVMVELGCRFEGNSPGCYFFNHPDYLDFKAGKITEATFDVDTREICNEFDDTHTIRVSKLEIIKGDHIKLCIQDNQCDNPNKWNQWEWNIFRVPISSE